MNWSLCALHGITLHFAIHCKLSSKASPSLVLTNQWDNAEFEVTILNSSNYFYDRYVSFNTCFWTVCCLNNNNWQIYLGCLAQGTSGKADLQELCWRRIASDWHEEKQEVHQSKAKNHSLLCFTAYMELVCKTTLKYMYNNPAFMLFVSTGYQSFVCIKSSVITEWITCIEIEASSFLVQEKLVFHCSALSIHFRWLLLLSIQNHSK